MSSLNDVYQAIWSAGTTGLPSVAFNPETAIAQKWLEEKAAGRFHGRPVTAEISIDEGGVAQGFASGAIFYWHGPGGQVEVK